MRWIVAGIVVVVVGIVVLLGVMQAGAGSRLKAGDAAPEFSLAGSDGRTHALADFRGRQAVVLAWFPKAFTGG
jgi:peroxiredoxin Q/BCP